MVVLQVEGNRWVCMYGACMIMVTTVLIDVYTCALSLFRRILRLFYIFLPFLPLNLSVTVVRVA